MKTFYTQKRYFIILGIIIAIAIGFLVAGSISLVNGGKLTSTVAFFIIAGIAVVYSILDGFICAFHTKVDKEGFTCIGIKKHRFNYSEIKKLVVEFHRRPQLSIYCKGKDEYDYAFEPSPAMLDMIFSLCSQETILRTVNECDKKYIPIFKKYGIKYYATIKKKKK